MLATCSIDLGTTNAIEGYLELVDHTTQRQHRLLVEHRRKAVKHLALRQRSKLILGARHDSSRLLGRLLIEFKPRFLGRQRSILVGKIDLGGPLCRFLFGNLGGRLGRNLHIFSHSRADLLIQSRKGWIFSSHYELFLAYPPHEGTLILQM